MIWVEAVEKPVAIQRDKQNKIPQQGKSFSDVLTDAIGRMKKNGCCVSNVVKRDDTQGN